MHIVFQHKSSCYAPRGPEGMVRFPFIYLVSVDASSIQLTRVATRMLLQGVENALAWIPRRWIPHFPGRKGLRLPHRVRSHLLRLLGTF